MMGKASTISLTSIYRDMINVPRLKSVANTSPLYGISEGRENSENTRGLTRDPLWLETCAHSYNSPTNVRRIYLSRRNVFIEFYTPFIVKGNPTSEGKYRKRVVNSTVGDIIRARCQLAVSGIQDMGYIAANTPRDRIVGHILGGTRSPWVLANLEEICVDTTGLFSEDVLSVIGYDALIDMEVRQNVSLLRNNLEIVIARLFGVASTSEIVNQFPRLRAVSIIPNLDNLIEAKVMATDDVNRYRLFMLYAKAKNAVDINTTACWFTPNVQFRETGDLITRSYYKFDSEVLSRYSANMKKQIEKVLARKMEAARAEQEAQAKELKAEAGSTGNSLSDVENRLNGIEAESGAEAARMALAISVAWITAAEKKEIYNGLSSEAKAKYGNILLV